MNKTDTWTSLKVTSDTTFLPQNLGFENILFIDLYNVIKELAEDQNGTVTYLRSYMDSPMPRIELKPSCLCPRHLSQLLNGFITNTQLCKTLSEKIALDCIPLPEPFKLSYNVRVTREFRIMLRSVSAPLKAASKDVFQRLVEKHKVESIDLEEEEEQTPCSVCLEVMSESTSEKIIRIPNCLHLFHQDCIFEWLRHRKSCPLCRCVSRKLIKLSEAVAET
ncbi:RING-H2 finger protein ATL2 [Cardamine amara subsp. amara]|uniref:RING-type E3 ubiquitin transferase n=1 Tax=Cardamine amara subsp. amara TaxID=228776 RepID=A0ABD0ZIJ1_CARAN